MIYLGPKSIFRALTKPLSAAHLKYYAQRRLQSFQVDWPISRGEQSLENSINKIENNQFLHLIVPKINSGRTS